MRGGTPLDGLREVLPQVEPVGDLDRRRIAAGAPVRAPSNARSDIGLELSEYLSRGVTAPRMRGRAGSRSACRRRGHSGQLSLDIEVRSPAGCLSRGSLADQREAGHAAGPAPALAEAQQPGRHHDLLDDHPGQMRKENPQLNGSGNHKQPSPCDNDNSRKNGRPSQPPDYQEGYRFTQ